MINTSVLRAKIYGKFGTQTQFNSFINWDNNKISRILRNKSIPDINDCAQIAKVLSLTKEEYIEIFLPDLSPVGDKK